VATVLARALLDRKIRRRAIVRATEIGIVAVLYFAVAKASLAFASINPSATPVWPPTGLALGLALVRGYRVIPAIFVGAFAVNLTIAWSPATSFLIAAGNSLEAFLGAFMLNRWLAGPSAFETPLGIAKFALVVAAVATPISATIGVLSLAVARLAELSSVPAVWATWWLGDLAGAVMVAPVIVLWANALQEPLERSNDAERPAIILLAAAVGILAFSPLLPAVAGRNALAFLAVLPLLWAALRRGPKDTALAALILSVFAVWGVAAGRGPFVQSTENESFLLVITFIVSTTLPSLALSAAVASRNRLLKQTQEELYQAQKLEALGQLTGGVAHDFNNLLMVISSGLRLLDRNNDRNRRADIVKSMQQAVDRGATLIRQLLAFARREELHPKLVDVASQIREMEELLQRTLGHNIEIELSVAPTIWPVNVDPTGLELVIINLAVNARDAMPRGGKLRIGARNVTAEKSDFGGFVAITVSDTGTGMSPEVQRRAVEPFFTTKGPGRGTGLGLSQVFGFITQSGGTVQIESETGRGTTVTLTLPKASGDVHLETPFPVPMKTASEEGAVLIVEDDDSVATMVCELIDDLGYRSIRVATAREALDALEQGRSEFDIVFTDIMMPGTMNGIDLARAVRQRLPDLPIVLTTAYAGLAEMPDTEFCVLYKPYGPEQLRQTFAKARRWNSHSPTARLDR
jgi:signal transduction histidine kinase/CheY-like chemotaxis protein